MVSSTIVTEVLASLTRVPKSRIVGYVAELRKAGIIDTKGRGRGGAEMEKEDIRSIVFAVLGAEMPKDAPEAVTRLMSLETKDGFTLGDAFMKYFHRMGVEDSEDRRPESITVNRSVPEAEITFRLYQDDLPTEKHITLFFQDQNFDYEQRGGFKIEATISNGVIQVLLNDLYHYEQMKEILKK
ncbi:hypothetical protein HRM2_47970 [Desulforapulum autotrophicum HRM2]|uniref:Uncharacterized protein n=1 Tax=Desulforapulum autotrophicum (strain ATCC 43914 / DSM 3382 / VKM B-1955 / HRM2) TaxID=177437 RepID=C0QHI7_DESAH|nr:hypothetical protein [Desulforapulum autotrophicum]ACN17846.1 hypothetical protein HRM2_47970 [Desulforapulum autotrophicum HRM2]